MSAKMSERYHYYRSLMFGLLWITYASFYLGRVNLSVAIPGIMQQFGYTKTQLGQVGTALFWAYAVGQFVNGLLGDKLGAKVMVAIGLGGSAVMNATFGLSAAFPFLVVVWALNGYFQAGGWGPTVRALANWFPHEVRGKMAGRLGTCYILGGAVSVLVAGLVLSITGRWEAVFFVPAVLLLLSMIHWLSKAVNCPEDIGCPPVSVVAGTEGLAHSLRQSAGNWRVWTTGFGLFCANILRYGFITWAPTYLFEQGDAISKAAFKSIAFPVAGAIGAVLAGWLSDRYFKSKRAPVAAVFLLGAGVLAWSFRFVPGDWWMSLLFLAGSGFAVFGAHPLLVAAAPMDYGTRKAASAATGLIDCIGYVGAGLTAVGTGFLVDRWGWDAGFWFWVLATGVGALLMLGLRLKGE